MGIKHEDLHGEEEAKNQQKRENNAAFGAQATQFVGAYPFQKFIFLLFRC